MFQYPTYWRANYFSLSVVCYCMRVQICWQWPCDSGFIPHELTKRSHTHQHTFTACSMLLMSSLFYLSPFLFLPDISFPCYTCVLAPQGLSVCLTQFLPWLKGKWRHWGIFLPLCGVNRLLEVILLRQSLPCSPCFHVPSSFCCRPPVWHPNHKNNIL